MSGAPGGFPEGFLWGAATSAWQVEGSPLADGAGPSIWTRFAHHPGNIAGGETGDVACDHYRRWPGDLDLLRGLGANAYRFSLAWARILPEGTGRVNPKGLDHYSRLVDGLLERGITPLVTLYHWDLPAALDDRGGWLNRDSADWFAEYAAAAARVLADRVPMWATLNEPWVSVDGGYLHGEHAPGHRNIFEAARAAHNLLRAHGAGMQALRAAGAERAGLVVNLEPKDPASADPGDVAAAERADAYMNRQFLDPVFLGRYPESLAAVYGPAWTDPPAADFALIGQPLDFLGVNYYSRNVVRHDPAAWPTGAARVRREGVLRTDLDWEVHPASFTAILEWVKERYGNVPLYVTENGAAFPDPPTAPPEGVDDPLRVDYLRTHLLALRTALARGVDVRGYFAWSLLDNVEWALGTTVRFGLVHVDYATQKRTPKASAAFYRSVIETGGAALGAGRDAVLEP